MTTAPPISYRVGFRWESPEGTREIVEIGNHPHRPDETVYVVRVTGHRSAMILNARDLALDIRRDTANVASRAARSAPPSSRGAPSSGRGWTGFTRSMTPAQRARADAALSTQMRVNGEFDSRGAHIRKLVERGYRVTVHPKRGRILEQPSGSYLTERDLTKTALDFAQFLSTAKR